VHSNKRAGHTPIGIVTAQVFRVDALQMLFANLFAQKSRLISDDVVKKSSKSLTRAKLLILASPIPLGDAG
jgi:hypothetical protein